MKEKGIKLPKNKFKIGKSITQILTGSYLLIYVGIIRRENLQIEGFWFYLFSGVFTGATLHYFIAKILGTVIFGRGWCGWACWTGMILDLFPWEKPQKEINYKLTFIRYVHFFIVLIIIVMLNSKSKLNHYYF